VGEDDAAAVDERRESLGLGLVERLRRRRQPDRVRFLLGQKARQVVGGLDRVVSGLRIEERAEVVEAPLLAVALVVDDHCAAAEPVVPEVQQEVRVPVLSRERRIVDERRAEGDHAVGRGGDWRRSLVVDKPRRTTALPGCLLAGRRFCTKRRGFGGAATGGEPKAAGVRQVEARSRAVPADVVFILGCEPRPLLGPLEAGVVSRLRRVEPQHPYLEGTGCLLSKPEIQVDCVAVLHVVGDIKDVTVAFLIGIEAGTVLEELGERFGVELTGQQLGRALPVADIVPNDDVVESKPDAERVRRPVQRTGCVVVV
jgi:hypothetical protein